MHSGRIALLNRLKKADEELLAAICEVEDLGPGSYSNLMEKQRGMIVEAMAAVYRRAMFIDDDYLTP